MTNIPVEALTMLALFLLWAATARVTERHCRTCGLPESNCKCNNS